MSFVIQNQFSDLNTSIAVENTIIRPEVVRKHKRDSLEALE